MKLNSAIKREKKLTHEGAVAYQHLTPAMELRRSIMSCLLWEDTFYESGASIGDRIAGLVPKVSAESIALMAVEAREQMKLRHLPLLLCCEMAKLATHRHVVKDTVAKVIQRADELTEVFAIYAKQNAHNRRANKPLAPLSKALQKGVARAFTKFDEYQLGKYNQDGAVKLRDALFLSHAKPINDEQAKLWKKLVDGTLATPDTWEVALSATKGEGKKEAWERLLKDGRVFALALLRNLRNMKEAGVSEQLVKDSILNMQVERVLPFRFITAATYAPQWEPQLEQAMFKCLSGADKLPGKTALVVDNSGSMISPKVSAKSELTRSDAACALAILLREICEDIVVIGFGTESAIIPARRGFALRDAIKRGPGGGTNTDTALALAEREGYNRIIVITDEQSHQSIRAPKSGTNGYFINVATYQNGIGYGPWTHIDGWSEAVLDYIAATEETEDKKKS